MYVFLVVVCKWNSSASQSPQIDVILAKYYWSNIKNILPICLRIYVFEFHVYSAIFSNSANILFGKIHTLKKIWKYSVLFFLLYSFILFILALYIFIRSYNNFKWSPYISRKYYRNKISINIYITWWESFCILIFALLSHKNYRTDLDETTGV